jgi:hypothetical protein
VIHHHLLSSLAVLVFLVSASAQAAPGAQEPARKAQAVQAAPAVQKSSEKAEAPAKETELTAEADYKAQRERDEARQRMWDRKMKALTGSICTGC